MGVASSAGGRRVVAHGQLVSNQIYRNRQAGDCMKTKKKSLDDRLWKIRELASQVEAISFLIRHYNAEIPLSQENYYGLGGVLETFSRRIKNISFSISEEMFELRRSASLNVQKEEIQNEAK